MPCSRIAASISYAINEAIATTNSMIEKIGFEFELPFFGRISSDYFTLVAAFITVAVATISSGLLNKAILELARKRLTSKIRIEERLISALLKGRWVLDFNPKKTNGKKFISFSDDGTIGLGRNNNENAWRLNSGLLEILSSDGKVFSRFKYVENEDCFLHTNDTDTLSIKGQRIYRDEKFEERI